MTDPILVIGYGSTLRSDDGVGPAVAERLAHDPRLEGATVISCHQLTPEMALDFSRARQVVLIDASHGPKAGSFTIGPVTEARPGTAPMTHHIDPSTIAELAGELYGSSPEVVMVRVGVASLDIGDRLTPLVEAAVPLIADAVAELLTAQDRAHA